MIVDILFSEFVAFRTRAFDNVCSWELGTIWPFDTNDSAVYNLRVHEEHCLDFWGSNLEAADLDELLQETE